MREFKLTITRRYYNSEEKEVQALKQLGFKFEPFEGVGWGNEDLRLSEDITIKVDNVTDLIDLCNMDGWDLVFNPERIEIYNDYRE
jgi:hypothetical protein